MVESYRGTEQKAVQHESQAELSVFKNELAAAFEGPFAVLGHGTNISKAQAILTEGLKARTPLLQTTAVPLENTPRGMREILHWPHHDHKAIIVIAIPLTTPSNAEFFDDIQTTYGEELPHILPPRFIRGYIDVENRKFIPNAGFEKNPTFRLKEPPKDPLRNFSAEPLDKVEIPRPASNGESSADIF
ncbi:MAG TPA: hypothetical protein VI483_02885 [Candidatus Paceibacterota bacterium]